MKSITANNVDGTENKSRKIKFSTWLNLKAGDQEMKTRFLVTDLGKEKIILDLHTLA